MRSTDISYGPAPKAPERTNFNEVLFVGERPGGPRAEVSRRLDPEWAISKTLVSWLGEGVFEATFVNVYPRFSSLHPDNEGLRREIGQAKPKIIIPLGMVACHALGIEHRVTLDSGEWYTTEGVAIVPFPHPSGRNRSLNGAEGRRLVERCVKALEAANEVEHREESQGGRLVGRFLGRALRVRASGDAAPRRELNAFAVARRELKEREAHGR